MNSKRIARLILATVLVAVTIGLTVGDHGAIGQTRASSDKVIEIPFCHVTFYRSAALATDRPGIIAEMPFDEGDSIAEGDLVVRLRDEIAAANLALATERAASEASVRVAEKEAAAAAVELVSAEQANDFSVGVVPGTTVERLRLIKEAREFAVIRAQDEVSLNVRAMEQAAAELDSYRIVSKQPGVVTRVYKREGEAVQQGEAVLDVIDPSVARIEGQLEFSQARRLRIGMPVEVRLDFPGEAELPVEQEMFVGTIGFIDVSATSRHEVRVWAEVQNRDGILLHDLPARMTIDVGATSDESR